MLNNNVSNFHFVSIYLPLFHSEMKNHVHYKVTFQGKGLHTTHTLNVVLPEVDDYYG